MLNHSSRTPVKSSNLLLEAVTLSAAKGLSAAPGCHPERSEGSGAMGTQMLRCAQHDSEDTGQVRSQGKSYLQMSG